MKSFVVLLSAVLLPAFAHADLACHGFNPAGKALPVTALVEVVPSRAIFHDETGVRVGHGLASVAVFALGKSAVHVTDQFTARTVTTRCKVGSTFSIDNAAVKLDLYVYDGCSQSPVNTLPAAYKGTLTQIVSGQPKSIYVACDLK